MEWRKDWLDLGPESGYSWKQRIQTPLPGLVENEGPVFWRQNRKVRYGMGESDAEFERPLRHPVSSWVFGSESLDTDLSWRYKLFPEKSVMKTGPRKH